MVGTSTPQLDDITSTQDSRISCPNIREITTWDCNGPRTVMEGFPSPFSRGHHCAFLEGEKEVEVVSNAHEDDGKRSGGWLHRGLNSCLTHKKVLFTQKSLS